MTYETIKVEMDTDLQDKLVEGYVLKNFSAGSIEVYHNIADQGIDDTRIEDQLFAAVLNEVINSAIKEEMLRMKEEVPPINKTDPEFPIVDYTGKETKILEGTFGKGEDGYIWVVVDNKWQPLMRGNEQIHYDDDEFGPSRHFVMNIDIWDRP